MGRYSVASLMYPIQIMATLLGFYPIKNLLSGYKGIKSLRFKLVSFPILYTLIFNVIIYGFGIETTSVYTATKYNQKVLDTDKFAKRTYFTSNFIVRFSVHILTILVSPKILRCLQELDDFDTRFRHKNKTCFLNSWTICTCFHTVTYLFAAYYISIPAIDDLLNQSLDKSTQLTSLSIIPVPNLIHIIYHALHTITELCVLFILCSISFIAAAIQDRLLSIRKDFQENLENWPPFGTSASPIMQVEDNYNEFSRTESEEDFKERDRDAVAVNMKAKSNERKRAYDESHDDIATYFIEKEVAATQLSRLNLLKEKFIKLDDLSKSLSAMSTWILLLLILGSTGILVSLVFSLTVEARNGNLADIADQNSLIILILGISLTCLSFMRVIIVANVGESLQDAHEALKSHLWRSSFAPKDRRMYRTLMNFKEMVSYSKIQLNSHGFFVINRSILIKIISPIVTFVVVLTQFRLNDLKTWKEEHKGDALTSVFNVTNSE